MRKNRSPLFSCLLMLILCASIVVGSTYAQFTDNVTVNGNIISTGRLKAGMSWTESLTPAEGGEVEWQDAADATIFDYPYWEPGFTDVKYIKIDNTGSLAFQYKLGVVPAQPLTGYANLMDVIDVYYAEVEAGTVVTREDYASKLTRVGTLSEIAAIDMAALQGILLPEKTSAKVTLPESAKDIANTGSVTGCIALHMQETAGNEYQNLSAGEGFNLQLYATQYTWEEDSFDNSYDEGAKLPVLTAPTNVTMPVKTDANGYVIEAVNFTSSTGVTATVPAGAKVEPGVTELTLVVEFMSRSAADVNLKDSEELASYNVKVVGLAADNTVPVLINLGKVLPEGLNMGNYELYHVENGKTAAMTLVAALGDPATHNTFTYDPVEGNVSVAMATFSEVALVADTTKAWEGNFDYSWYNAGVKELTIANADQMAAFGAIVGGMADGIDADSFAGKTVKLIADVNLGDDEENNKADIIFYPIGYYNSTGSYAKSSGGSVTSSVNSFEGTFDGNGHTIANFYQNTWEMFGDYNDGYNGTPNHYKDAMGLFGYVLNGTVENLTVDNFSSDGEFTPTGVIAAYAVNSTFENIAITNCNPRVYNTGNGGIIGIAGDTSADDDDHLTLKNITVDNTNKISALWGSWDVACGGLVGMYRGNVDGSGNATGDTISFENCHVSAQIDVYNDVCANYQYYAYRYAGMIIGSVRHNTTNAAGKTIPNMTGISASGCTVNYGDWNDYYYCEFEKNSMASYSEDYQFSRVPHSELSFTDSNSNGVVDADERASVTGCKHTHTAEENHQAIYLPFHQLFTGYGWGVNSIGLVKYSGIVTNLDITEGDQQESVEKFETKFTGDFLYRVGNQNAVSLSSLFAAKDGALISDSGVWVSVDKVDEDTNVSGTFTANTSDWTKGTIKFSGTGPVKVTIQDYNFCKPTVLYLEVVDAVNVTTATSATENNVVLLNDCGFSSLEVSGGYALYGNGFTMTCASDSAAADMGYAFVTLNNGTLDNVQIDCPNFDYAALYKSNLTSSDNRSDSSGTRYYNARSGVMASGNSQILNSRISGGRAAVNVSGGNVVIDNSRIELGAVANILVGAANSLTLRDVTLVQKPTASTYDSSKTLIGFSVLFICNADGNAAPVTIEGELIQNAWVDENDKQYVPESGQSIVSTVLSQTEYMHDIDGDGTNESLNLGFAYMPESLTSKVNTTTITDNRTNKDKIPYDYAEVSILNGKTYVYSYKNTNGTADSFKTESEYVPNKYSDIITVSYSDTADGLTTGKSYGTDGWVYELNVDLDKLTGYALDFSKLSMSVNGVTVTDFKVNGNAKPTSPLTVAAGGTTYTLTATIDGKAYTVTYKVTGTETSKESPTLVASNYEAALLVGEAGSTFSKDTWHGAAPALNGIQIKYWSVAEKKYKTITLSDYTPTTAGKQNGTNTTWTYSPDNGDFTLTLTGGQVHSSNNVNAMPVVCNSKLYFVAAGSNGLVNYGNSARTIPVTYSFKDNNGGTELTFSHTWSIECANGDTAYDYSDFCNGTSKTFTIKSSNGNGCVTPDTLVTLADGTKKEIQYVQVGEEVLAWNFYTGAYEVMPVSLLQAHYTGEQDVLHLTFDDGTVLKVLGEHGIFDVDAKTFIFIDKDDVTEYIGRSFLKQDGEGFKKVKLVDCKVETEYTTAYTILSTDHYNVMLEDLLTVTPAHVGDNFFNPFEIGENMKYDDEAVQRDIEKYGLYTYDEFAHLLTEEQFEALQIAHFKVSVGKGLITHDGLIYLIETFINGDF